MESMEVWLWAALGVVTIGLSVMILMQFFTSYSETFSEKIANENLKHMALTMQNICSSGDFGHREIYDYYFPNNFLEVYSPEERYNNQYLLCGRYKTENDEVKDVCMLAGKCRLRFNLEKNFRVQDDKHYKVYQERYPDRDYKIRFTFKKLSAIKQLVVCGNLLRYPTN
jgi:hypothetical protein